MFFPVDTYCPRSLAILLWMHQETENYHDRNGGHAWPDRAGIVSDGQSCLTAWSLFSCFSFPVLYYLVIDFFWKWHYNNFRTIKCFLRVCIWESHEQYNFKRVKYVFYMSQSCFTKLCKQILYYILYEISVFLLR